MKTILLTLFAPNYWKEMPKKESGNFLARVYTFSIRRDNLRYVRSFNDRREAYIMARWMALMWDWKTDSHNGQVGVSWEVVKL